MDIEAKQDQPPRTRWWGTVAVWMDTHRKWLPQWLRFLGLKMVRRTIGVQNFNTACDVASKQYTPEQVAEALQHLRDAGVR